MPAAAAATVAERIRTDALALGFDAVAMGPVDTARDGERLRRWLDEGMAGTMDWMRRNPDRRADASRTLQGARSVVAVALRHDPGRTPGAEPAPAEGPPRGFIARYARGRDYHRVLAVKLRRLRDAVVRAGGPGTRAYWSLDYGPLMDRALARNAGLGFFGKSTSLIRPGLGSYFVLGEVVTDLDLPADAPRAGSCGTCARCIEACPTRAILGPHVLDARRCISYLTIEHRGTIPEDLRPALGTMVFGCDICQEVCPWNRFARPASEADLRPRALAVDPDLIRMAAMTEAEWKAAFRGMAVLRAGWSGFRRNLALALGNAGDPVGLPALRGLASCGDPLVEEHARWSISRMDCGNK
jgi:epoxyqueuosine reductase